MLFQVLECQNTEFCNQISTIVNEGCTVKPDTVFVHDTTNISATFVCFIKSYGQKAFLFSDPIADLTVSKVKVEWDTNSFDMVKDWKIPLGWDMISLRCGERSKTHLFTISISGFILLTMLAIQSVQFRQIPLL